MGRKRLICKNNGKKPEKNSLFIDKLTQESKRFADFQSSVRSLGTFCPKAADIVSGRSGQSVRSLRTLCPKYSEKFWEFS